MKTLLINNFSPYLCNIIKYLNDFNIDWSCLNSDNLFTIEYLNDLLKKYDNVILSGRQKNSKIINKLNSSIIRGCYALDKPLLGICYGGQILALTMGGTLKKIEKVRDIVKIDILKPTNLLPNYLSVEMFESHNYCISTLTKSFSLLGSSIHCKNEFFCFEGKPLYGTQFHPEKSGRHGRYLIENFLKL
ncbi:MAG: glutamine amidotransferase-related protein [Candidatus Nitrosocosmicus sp.]